MNGVNKNIRLSIKNKLLFWFLTISTLSIVSITILSYYKGKKMIVDYIGEEVYEDAIKAMNDIDIHLYEALANTKLWATLDIGARVLDEEDTKFFVDFVNQIVEKQDKYDLILMTNKEGKLIATNTHNSKGKIIDTASLSGMDLSGESWFKKTIESKGSQVIITDLHTPKNFSNTV